MPKLTKRAVDEAAPAVKPFFVWCSELRGFGCRIYPTGRKTFYADYRNDAGSRKRMKLGDLGKITCDEARKLALAALGGVAKGDDPLTERQTRRASLTVAELCERYLAAAEKGLILGKRRLPKKASTLATDRGRIERHIIPLMGRKLVIDLSTADITKFVRDVAAGKTATVEKTGKPRGKAIVEGGAGTAARTTGLLGGILSFAVSEGIIDHNPARGVKRPADGQRTRRLSPEEYRALGDALAQAERDGDTWQGIAGVRLLALTGCRLGEIVHLRWADVDRASGCFRLGDTKEGASVRPIGRRAFDVLADLPRHAGPYVLPGAMTSDVYGALDSFISKITERAGLSGVTAHTLRHSFASSAGDMEFSELTIAAMLGHAKVSVTSRYIHKVDAALAAVADRVAGTISAMLDGREAEVVNLQISHASRVES